MNSNPNRNTILIFYFHRFTTNLIHSIKTTAKRRTWMSEERFYRFLFDLRFTYTTCLPSTCSFGDQSNEIIWHKLRSQFYKGKAWASPLMLKWLLWAGIVGRRGQVGNIVIRKCTSLEKTRILNFPHPRKYKSKPVDTTTQAFTQRTIL